MGLGRSDSVAKNDGCDRASAPTGIRDAYRSEEREEFDGRVGGDGAVDTVPRLGPRNPVPRVKT
ncbi:Uncharacterized protein ToN1_29100 [Aromatoleum petrolei]|nr:Uncharacterized protein ToN1_29100 [Aromatoleum petrolei]